MISTAHRLIDLLRAIPVRGQGSTARDLREALVADGWDVHLRSVQRDLQDLSTKFALTSTGKPLRWRWASDRAAIQIPGIDPTGAIIWALVEAHLSKLLPPALLNEFKPQFRAANEVLRHANKGRAAWPKRISAISTAYPLIPPKVDASVFQVISECLQARLSLKIAYRARYQSRSKPLDISPLGLLLRDQTPYLIAIVDNYEAPIQLALHRIERAVRSETPARQLQSFDLEEYSRSAIVRYPVGGSIKVKLRFSDEAGFHLTEATLSQDQSIDQQPDGSYFVRATVADTAQLRWWLLGFGAGVEVLGPCSLRKEIASYAEQMAARYRSQDKT